MIVSQQKAIGRADMGHQVTQHLDSIHTKFSTIVFFFQIIWKKENLIYRYRGYRYWVTFFLTQYMYQLVLYIVVPR